MWEPKLCCCFQLRTGSLIIGILFLISGLFSVIGGIRTLVAGDENIRVICKDEDNVEKCMELYMKIELGLTCSSLVVAAFHIIFSSLLIHGVLKQKTAFFVPLMVAYLVQIGFMILVSVLVIGVIMFLELPFAAVVIFSAIMGLAIFLETYFLLVIRAHYYEIKRAKGQIHLALKDENVEAYSYPYPQAPPPPYPGPQAPLPPYSPINEPSGYPGSDTPLYPDIEKVPK